MSQSDYKVDVRRLADGLREEFGLSLSPTQSLHLYAKAKGFCNWQAFSAIKRIKPPHDAQPITPATIPDDMVADVAREFGYLKPECIRRMLAIALAPSEDRRQAAADRRRETLGAASSLPFSHNWVAASTTAQAAAPEPSAVATESHTSAGDSNVGQWLQYLRARFSHLGYDDKRLLEMAELLNDSPIPGAELDAASRTDAMGDAAVLRFPASTWMSIESAVQLLQLDVEAGIIKLASLAAFPLTDEVRIAAIDMLPLSWPNLPHAQLIDRLLRKWSYDPRLAGLVASVAHALERGEVPKDRTPLSEDDIKRILSGIQVFGRARLGKIGFREGEELIRDMPRGLPLTAYARALLADRHLAEIAGHSMANAEAAMAIWRQRRIVQHGRAPESPMWPFAETMVDEPRR